MPSNGFQNVVKCIASAENWLSRAEDTLKVSQTEDHENMEYTMTNKYAVIKRPFVELGKLLTILYKMRNSILTEPAKINNSIGELIELYKGATRLEQTKTRFPPTGVFVDLGEGTCATNFLVLLQLCNGVSATLHEPVSKYMEQLIAALEDYDSHLDVQDATIGIYNRNFFEHFYSAKWEEAVENVDVGHYEMRNSESLSSRPFINLSQVLGILYSWRILNTGKNWLNESEDHVNQLRDIIINPVYLLKDPRVRFPANGVYIDTSKGNCFDLCIIVIRSGRFELQLLEMIEDYESNWDDPKCGIYDRTHFETHFSAEWINELQT